MSSITLDIFEFLDFLFKLNWNQIQMLHRVVVTGIGVVSPYGAGFDLLMTGLFEGRSALRYSKELGFVVSLFF